MKFRYSCLGMWAMASLASSLTAFAAPTTQSVEADYGEMYVIQTQETPKPKWQTSLGYSYGFSNPYIGVHGIEVALSRKLGKFFSVGLLPVYYVTSQKDVARELTNQLSAQGIQTKVDRPKYSGYLTFGVTPLSGMLNWFSTSAVDFDFVVSMGFGASRYSNELFYLPSARLMVGPELMLGKNLGFSGGFLTVYDRFQDGEWQNRVAGTLNMIGRF